MCFISFAITNFTLDSRHVVSVWCPDPPVFPYSILSAHTSNFENETARYDCVEGYGSVNGLGYVFTTCMHDGTWNRTVDPFRSK